MFGDISYYALPSALFISAFVSAKYIFPPLTKKWDDAILLSVTIALLSQMLISRVLLIYDEPFKPELLLIHVVVILGLPTLMVWLWKQY